METSNPAQQLNMEALALLQDVTDQTATIQEVASDVAYMKIILVNVCLVGAPNDQNAGWVLIDTGLPEASESIVEAAGKRFGTDRPPKAIILTHGHFDHVGAITELLKHWDVPVYAHEKELPYLTGKADYPPGDPEVSGGLLAKLSPLYPNKAINLGERVQPLPQDESVPNMPGWRWVHTPGHTPGHVALFRETDRLLIAGDAFVTVKPESLLKVMVQEKEVHGPPAYFTPNWMEAGDSVKRLRSLNPSLAVTGHGRHMGGEELLRQLDELAKNFDTKAIPDAGEYAPVH